MAEAPPPDRAPSDPRQGGSPGSHEPATVTGSGVTSGPLAGRRVIVCRAESDAGPLTGMLRALGGEPVAVPLLARGAPADGGEGLRAALDRLDRYAWLAVTSAAGAAAVLDALAGRPMPPGVQVAAVGPATAAAFERAGVTVDFVPPSATAADLALSLPRVGGERGGSERVGGERVGVEAHPVVLAPLAELAGDDLVDGLRARGFRVDRVDAYRLVDAPAELSTAMATAPTPTPTPGDLARTDAVLFTSSSVVDRFLDRFGPPGLPPLVVCIGPRTAERARRRGVRDPAVAAEHTVAGLVAALVAALAGPTS